MKTIAYNPTPPQIVTIMTNMETQVTSFLLTSIHNTTVADPSTCVGMASTDSFLRPTMRISTGGGKS